MQTVSLSGMTNSNLPVTQLADVGHKACVEGKVDGDPNTTSPLSIEIKVNLSSLPGPSSESTDTSSEVGSGLSSPGSSQCSPLLQTDSQYFFYFFFCRLSHSS